MKRQLSFLKMLFTGLLLCLAGQSSAQTTVTTGLPSSAGSGSGANYYLTFIVENTNSYPIVISDIEMYRAAASNGNNFSLYYSSTSLSGVTGVAATANSFASAVGWTAVSTVIH